MANIYIVATPIGNLEDMTLRAIRVLYEVDLILCEDTRVTRKLLEHYKIKTPTESYHSQSKISKTEYILNLLKDSKNLALVSDAGTPGISDPGVVLVAKIRAELPEVKIIPIPGPSALATALSVAGAPTHEFTFYGFLPHKKGRETIFKEIASAQRTTIFYESPHRIMKTLESLAGHIPERDIVILRELTKLYEEIIKAKPTEHFEYFMKNKDKVRGEFTVIIFPK